ncbi:hypothetical protein DPEC_G00100950 [Dallia pectoralis]|uniref:Uncharacterized protein n=1 Tax=Dallia pectoralis TaxID=75939 RepID=A0ACC2GX11_DALPE|nr:hypothetical protein DPEC_G00100950 [Dallia pectoralis]
MIAQQSDLESVHLARHRSINLWPQTPRGDDRPCGARLERGGGEERDVQGRKATEEIGCQDTELHIRLTLPSYGGNRNDVTCGSHIITDEGPGEHR